MPKLTKRKYLAARECPRLGWYLHSPETPTDADNFRMEQGQEIGRLARLLHPDGILVEERDPIEAATRTAQLLADPETSTIFEATFIAEGCTAKADILTRGTDGWIIKEVKSALEFGGIVDDIAYTVMVAKAAGLQIEKSHSLLVSRDYRKGMPPQDLFIEEDVTELVEAQLPELEADLDRIRVEIGLIPPPEAQFVPACRACEFFRTECIGRNLDNPITEIPRLHWNRLSELASREILEIDAIPEDFPLTDTQRIVADSTRTNRPYISPDLGTVLAGVEWPVAYLDFETVATAIPLYPGVAPYEQVTTQFSIHICDGSGHLAHHEFLADPVRDCRRELAEKLLSILPERGSIIVYYASFEQGQLTQLAEMFPDLAPQLNALIPRLYDLERVIRFNYYHPGFRGSYSIKRVLPVLVPALSYEGLPIGDGDAAVAGFARMALGQYDSDQVSEVRRQLLAYCRLDTLAMVELHHKLLEIAAAEASGRG